MYVSIAATHARSAAPLPQEWRVPPRLSLIMVVYMTGPTLMESVRHALAEPRVEEFVIVDNGSSLADAAWLRDLARRARPHAERDLAILDAGRLRRLYRDEVYEDGLRSIALLGRHSPLFRRR